MRKAKERDEIVPFNVIQNGNKRYYPRDGHVFLEEMKEDEMGIPYWTGNTSIMACEPYHIRDVYNKETKELLYEVKGKYRKRDFKERFKSIELLRNHIYSNYTVDMNHSRAYIALLRAKEEEDYFFIPDGISYIDDKYCFYEDEEEVILEDINMKKVKKGKEQLKHHEEISNLQDKKMFRTLFKWIVVSPFFFALKNDKNLRESEFVPYLIFNGSPDTAKTSSIKIFTDINKEEVEGPETIGSPFRLAEYFSTSKNFLAIDEAAHILSPYNKKMNDTLKSNSMNKIFTARGNQQQEMRKFMGKRTAAFMTNDLYKFEATFKRRCIILTTNKEDTVTEESREKYIKLSRQNYKDNLSQLLTYLRLKIVKNLNEKESSFYKAVDEVLKEEGMEEYIESYEIDETRDIVEEEEVDIYQTIFSYIDKTLFRKLSARDLDEDYDEEGDVEIYDTTLKQRKINLLKNGAVPGIYYKFRRTTGKYGLYATSEFNRDFNNNVKLDKHISLKRMADIFGQQIENIYLHKKSTKSFDISIVEDYITDPGKEEPENIGDEDES